MSPPAPCTECLDRVTDLKEMYPSNSTMPSSDDIAEKLRDGYVPVSSSELEDLKTFVVDAPQKLVRYDETIAQMKRTLRELEEARDEFQSSLTFAFSSLSPIRKLPTDILVEIFALCSRQEGHSLLSTGSIISEWRGSGYIQKYIDGAFVLPTMKLTWICSFWRNIIQSRPTLWSSMDLALDSFTMYPNRIDIVREHISRSCSAPLDLRLRVGSIAHDRADFNSILLNSCARWRRVQLKGDDLYWAFRMTDRMRSQRDEPILEYVDVSTINSDEMAYDRKKFLESLTVCPKLTTLRGQVFWSSDLCCADFSRLTQLDIGTLDESLGLLLCRLPNLSALRVVKFRLTGAPDGLVQLNGSYYTSGLSKLSLTSDTFHHEAWEFVHIPRLTYMDLTIEEYKSWTEFATLNDVLLNSRCVLQVLKITFAVTAGDVAIDLISSHPSVHHLYLDLGRFSSSYVRLLHSLIVAENSRCPAPDLRTLEVLIPKTGEFSEPSDWLGAFVDLIAALCRVVESRLGVDPVPGNSELSLEMPQFESLTVKLRDAEVLSILFYHHIRSKGVFDRIKEAGVRVEILWF